MKINNVKEKILYLLAVGFSIAVLMFLVMCVWIGHEVKSLCQNAQWQCNNPDCVEALITQLNDENQGYRHRNHAIWALGQCGDARALPELEKYFSGVIPDREPLDETISQYELKKAIEQAKGGINLTTWAWR